jgi:hypothetical protein
MFSQNSESLPPPIDKKCHDCKKTKILSEYDFSKKAKDGRAQTCKECRQLKEYQNETCLCSCDSCKDRKLLEATASMIKLILTRLYEDEGLKVSNHFRRLVVELASELLDKEEARSSKKDS